MQNTEITVDEILNMSLLFRNIDNFSIHNELKYYKIKKLKYDLRIINLEHENVLSGVISEMGIIEELKQMSNDDSWSHLTNELKSTSLVAYHNQYKITFTLNKNDKNSLQQIKEGFLICELSKIPKKVENYQFLTFPAIDKMEV